MFRRSLRILCAHPPGADTDKGENPYNNVAQIATNTTQYTGTGDVSDFVDSSYLHNRRPRLPGGAWETSILRTKSMADLQQIWYTLLKERNMLLSMKHHYTVHTEELGAWPAPSRLKLVDDSMANIKHVIKERDFAAVDEATAKFYQSLEEEPGTYAYPPGPSPTAIAEEDPSGVAGSRLTLTVSKYVSPDRIRELFGRFDVFESHKGIAKVTVDLPPAVLAAKEQAEAAFQEWVNADKDFRAYKRLQETPSWCDYGNAFELAPGVFGGAAPLPAGEEGNSASAAASSQGENETTATPPAGQIEVPPPKTKEDQQLDCYRAAALRGSEAASGDTTSNQRMRHPADLDADLHAQTFVDSLEEASAAGGGADGKNSADKKKGEQEADDSQQERKRQKAQGVSTLIRLEWSSRKYHERQVIQYAHFPNVAIEPPRDPGPRPTHPDEIEGPWTVSILYDTNDGAEYGLSLGIERVDGADIVSSEVAADPYSASEKARMTDTPYAEAMAMHGADQRHQQNWPHMPIKTKEYEQVLEARKPEDIIAYNWTNQLDYLDREALLTGRSVWELPYDIDPLCGKQVYVPPYAERMELPFEKPLLKDQDH